MTYQYVVREKEEPKGLVKFWVEPGSTPEEPVVFMYSYEGGKQSLGYINGKGKELVIFKDDARICGLNVNVV